VTLAGDWHVARAGVSVLGAAGLSDWIAEDDDGYAAVAAEKAADPESLSRLRAGMRARLLASPLMDGRRFTRALERAFAGAYGASLRNVSR
jgi:protein O-GlcNAc transferase